MSRRPPQFRQSSGRQAKSGKTFYGNLEKKKSIKIPNGVKTIAEGALFLNDNLKVVYIPKTVSKIKEKAFGTSKSLRIKIASKNQYYYVSKGCVVSRRSGRLVVAGIKKGVITIPEKVTAEQAMYVLEHFAKDVLGDDYEAVYAVHTDREHMHGHLIWNSVSMTTGKKYNSPKGNWKNHLQPITNKYCDELGLSIMPAEYSRNPKNISRDKWEKEMSLKSVRKVSK